MLRVMPPIEADMICVVFEMYKNALDVSFIVHICVYIELVGPYFKKNMRKIGIPLLNMPTCAANMSIYARQFAYCGCSCLARLPA
jgi:hypothetical protein